MIYNISSKDNKNLKLIRQLKRKSFRTEHKQFIAEGKRIVLEAFEYAPKQIFCIAASEDFFAAEPAIIEKAEGLCERVYIVPQNIFNDLSDTDTPQGIMAVINMPVQGFIPNNNTNGIIVLDGVSEPGNMGTVIRTAEALGFDGIYLMKGCTDIYSPKTVRATMGSIFRMRFRDNCSLDDINALKDSGFSVISTTPAGDIALESFLAPKSFAVVIGNEAHGVSDDILNLSDFKIRITMDGMAESLNAAVAAGIAMHWLKNSRGS